MNKDLIQASRNHVAKTDGYENWTELMASYNMALLSEEDLIAYQNKAIEHFLQEAGRELTKRAADHFHGSDNICSYEQASILLASKQAEIEAKDKEIGELKRDLSISNEGKITIHHGLSESEAVKHLQSQLQEAKAEISGLSKKNAKQLEIIGKLAKELSEAKAEIERLTQNK